MSYWFKFIKNAQNCSKTINSKLKFETLKKLMLKYANF